MFPGLQNPLLPSTKTLDDPAIMKPTEDKSEADPFSGGQKILFGPLGGLSSGGGLGGGPLGGPLFDSQAAGQPG